MGNLDGEMLRKHKRRSQYKLKLAAAASLQIDVLSAVRLKDQCPEFVRTSRNRRKCYLADEAGLAGIAAGVGIVGLLVNGITGATVAGATAPGCTGITGM